MKSGGTLKVWEELWGREGNRYDKIHCTNTGNSQTIDKKLK